MKILIERNGYYVQFNSDDVVDLWMCQEYVIQEDDDVGREAGKVQPSKLVLDMRHGNTQQYTGQLAEDIFAALTKDSYFIREQNTPAATGKSVAAG